MPEQKLKEAPQRIKDELPESAQRIYVATYNKAIIEYADPKKRRGNETQEQTAHKVAWAAVEKEYSKGSDGKWHLKSK